MADTKKHGVEVRPIDVNRSNWDSTLEKNGEPGAVATGENSSSPVADAPGSPKLVGGAGPALRLGFRLVRGLSQKYIERIVEARGDVPFTTFSEFVQRTGLRAAVLKRLSHADAFGSLALDRQATLWRSLPERGPLTLFDQFDQDEAEAALPTRSTLEEVLADYSTAGLTLRQHPVSFLRPMLETLKVAPASRLCTMPNDCRLKVAGIVVMRQRPSTAKGITFVTLEDETGMVNMIVRQAVWERDRRVARGAIAMIAHGRLQRVGEIIHVLVSRMEDLSQQMGDFQANSRDFR